MDAFTPGERPGTNPMEFKMKTGSTLDDLLVELERRAEGKRDLVVPTNHLRMTEDKRVIVDDREEYDLNGIAHDQIGEWCGIPGKYYDKMLTNDPKLLSTNVNAWFGRKNEKGDFDRRMLRTINKTGRAFLSDSYRQLENEDLALVVIPALRDAGADIMSCQVTDRRLYIKAVDPKVTRELKAVGGKFGDGQHNIVRCLAPAITISNSEVGMGATSVLGGVYDSWCSNLATFGERSVRKYHVGARHQIVGEEHYAVLTDETRAKTDEATLAQIRDVVKAAFERAKFDALCNKIAETQEHKIDGDPTQVVTLTSRKLGLTEGEGKLTLRHLMEGADYSRFGLYNAITRAAQDVESYDRATELERIGAQVIELPAKDWKPILQAA